MNRIGTCWNEMSQHFGDYPNQGENRGSSHLVNPALKTKLSLNVGNFTTARVENELEHQPIQGLLEQELIISPMFLSLQPSSIDSTKRLLSFAAFTEIEETYRRLQPLLLPEPNFLCPTCNEYRTTYKPPLRASLSKNFRGISLEKHRKLVPAIDYNPIQRSLLINKFTVPRQVIFVESDLDLLLRTTINKRGKTIEFRAVNSYNGFRGKIEASFPPFSVLGEEKVFLEIVPEPLVRAWNEASKKLNSRVPAIITPILHIDRENDFPFLRDVEISLPIFPRVLRENCKMLDNISVQNGRAHLRESKFSPKAVCYDDIQGILRALRIDTHFRLAFKKLGVYLLVEQFPQNKFLFDLRPFRDEEEHRLFRMDEKKTFRMIVNPQLVDDESVYLSEVSIIIQDPAVLKNHENFRNVIGRKINFNFPNLKCDVDCTNERKVTVESKNEKLKSFGVEFEFASSLLDKRGIDGTINIPIHSEDTLEKISTRRYLPSRGMLLEFLKSLGSNWTKFLSCYLMVEMSCLKDFVDRDIRASLPPRVLNWSEIIRKQLKTETDAREFQEVLCLEELVQTMLRNYQTSHDLFKAKAEILEILEDSEVLASDHRCSAALAPESRESLVAALLFMPIMELREAMNASFVRGKLFSPTPDVEHFIYDGELPEGEGTTMQQNGFEN